MGTFQEKVNKVFSNNPKLCLLLIHHGYIVIKQVRTDQSLTLSTTEVIRKVGAKKSEVSPIPISEF